MQVVNDFRVKSASEFFDFRQPSGVDRDLLAGLICIDADEFMAEPYLVRLVRRALMHDRRKRFIGSCQEDQEFCIGGAKVMLAAAP